MGTYNKSGVLQAVLAVFTRIDQKGRAIPGPRNRFYSDSLVSTEYSMTYNRQDEISIPNGAGAICMTYSPPQTLTRLELADIAFCYPDPQAIEFIAGGVIFEDDAQNPIGYGAPKVGVDPKPQGFAMELYSSQVANGAVVGYVRWLFPRAKLQFTKSQNLNGTDPHQTAFDGICNENPFFADGPNAEFADWPTTDRVFQWMQVDDLPAFDYGYAEVTAPVVTP